jgi:hypothetical protein
MLTLSDLTLGHGGNGRGVDNRDARTLAARARVAERGAGYAIGDVVACLGDCGL